MTRAIGFNGFGEPRPSAGALAHHVFAGGNTLHGFKDTESGSRQGQNLALTALFVPSSPDSGFSNILECSGRVTLQLTTARLVERFDASINKASKKKSVTQTDVLENVTHPQRAADSHLLKQFVSTKRLVETWAEVMLLSMMFSGLRSLYRHTHDKSPIRRHTHDKTLTDVSARHAQTSAGHTL